MNFEWSEGQNEQYARWKRFGRERLNSPGPPAGRAVADWRERMTGEGLYGLILPEQFGGMGLEPLDAARVFEALGEGCNDLGPVFSLAVHTYACAAPVARFGGEALQQELLPGLAAGGRIGANAATEAKAGSDVFAMEATAVADGTFYILNGSKQYVGNCPGAHLILVYAKTAPADGFLGLSAFAVDAHDPGIEIGEPVRMSALPSATLAPVTFQDCRVPASRMLGRPGDGARIFQWSMRLERSGLFAAYLGVMQRQLDRSVEYARTRRQFGKAIGTNQAVSHRIADMGLRLESARLLLYRACWRLQRDRDGGELDAALAKLAVSEAAVHSAMDAIRIHGGLGVTAEANLLQELNDAVPGTIFSGTSDMQREIIARELGL